MKSLTAVFKDGITRAQYDVLETAVREIGPTKSEATIEGFRVVPAIIIRCQDDLKDRIKMLIESTGLFQHVWEFEG